MPDIDEIGESKAKSSSTKTEPDSAAVGLSLETKLANAREKRARILAARQAEAKRKGKSKKSQGLSKTEGAEPASVRHQLSERFSFGFAGTVLLVFVGSLGFGFGVSFGASAITGARVLPVASEASAAAAEPGLVPSVAAVSTTALADTGENTLTVDPEKAAFLIARTDNVAIAVDVESYAALQSPVTVGIEALVLPQINKVVYLSSAFAAPAVPMRDEVRAALPAENLGDAVATIGTPIYLQVPNGISQQRLNAYIAELERSGFGTARIGRVAFRVSKTHLRFYTDDVASDAATVAAGLGIEARDFTSIGSDSQRLEIYVQGRAQNEQGEGPSKELVSRVLQRLAQER